MSQMQTSNQNYSKKQLSSGKCKWFNVTKGYGFIEMDDKSDDVFVHQSALKCRGFRSLQEGEALEFEVETDHTGRRKAINVTGPNGDYCIGQKREYNDDGYDNRRGGGGGYNNRRGGYNNNSYGGGYNNNRGGYNSRRY